MESSNRIGQETSHSTGGAKPNQFAETRKSDGESVISRTAGELADRGAQVYNQTKQVVANAYDKTSEVLGESYQKAATYTRENPGKLGLVALFGGIGLGLLLAKALMPQPRRRWYERIF